MVEVTAYTTPTGIQMVMCPCRIKVRVLKDGTLANHWAYDEECRDPDSLEDRCVHRGKRFEKEEGEVLGCEWGRLVDP